MNNTIKESESEIKEGYNVNQVLYIAHLIEDYLKDHPEAMDTFDGIANWWVTRQKIYESANTVNKALRLLIKKGIVEKVDQYYYRYAKD